MNKILSNLILIFFLIGCSPTAAQVQEAINLTESARSTSTQTLTATKIATQTKTPTIIPSNTPTLTQINTSTKIPTKTNTSEPKSNVMYGVTPAYLQVKLEEQDFSCEVVYAPTNNDPYYKWECKREDLTKSMLLEIWSTSVSFISLIRTRIIQFGDPKDSISIDYLGFIATLPYDGSNPQQASEWVENTLPKVADTGEEKEIIIGEIRFQLYGNPSNMSLKIGEDL